MGMHSLSVIVEPDSSHTVMTESENVPDHLEGESVQLSHSMSSDPMDPCKRRLQAKRIFEPRTYLQRSLRGLGYSTLRGSLPQQTNSHPHLVTASSLVSNQLRISHQQNICTPSACQGPCLSLTSAPFSGVESLPRRVSSPRAIFC